MKRFFTASPLVAAYIGYVILQCFDFCLTALILSRGGVEVNPLSATLIQNYGFGALALNKLFFVAVTILACELLRPMNALAAGVTIRIGVFLYFGVVLWECALLSFPPIA